METEGYRQQKANELADQQPQQPQQPFMSFSPEEAAAARNAAAQEAAAQKKGGDAGQASQPAPSPSPRDAAAAAINKVRHEVNDLEKQVCTEIYG